MASDNAQGQSQAPRYSDLAAVDVDTYKNRRRLERILDAQDNVEDTDQESIKELAQGQITHDGRNIALLKAVQRFIGECSEMLREHAMTREEDDPDYWVGDEDTPIGVIQFDNTDEVVEFYGLRDIYWADFYYVTSWEEKIHHRNGPSETIQKVEEKTVPAQISRAAYINLKAFLKEERDLDISFDGKDYVSTDPGL